MRTLLHRTEPKVGRRLQWQLTFQAIQEKERGLPPIWWQKRLEFKREVEATYNTNTCEPQEGREMEGWGRLRPAPRVWGLLPGSSSVVHH